jgi:ADP-ribose pyrophosphatase
MSENVFEGKLIDVVVRDGKEVVLHGPAVAIVAVDAQDRVVLVRQQRAPVGGKVLELPAGGVEDGEAPEASARRELREETGLRGGDWFEAASVFTTPGYSDERIHIFFASNLEEGEDDLDPGEEVELVRVPVADVPTLLDEVEDAKTLAGLLLYLRLR